MYDENRSYLCYNLRGQIAPVLYLDEPSLMIL